ncbi:requim, req/dpf2, putative [Pediculus humanus corporis]|uniref:Requim, req/dpf2, putative n=1 Tax=Pediculus humanus subsp. corporis TaxID=121224 RepID=E0VEM2_PEDHC|nr:requim, req/dpf2, putative [Pediculus humanus corporis]EEB11828.1 requim, req/dpf2, putative [Pediculus humanus corporis]
MPIFKHKMSACDIQVVNQAALEKIESFINDPAYCEVLESSAGYNSRICIERRLRMPFLDSHTGVAQNHSDLFKNKRQRMPGFLQGQIYTYPSKRWCKRRRQYLMNWMNPRRKETDDGDSNVGDNPIINEDSKDSCIIKDENAKDSWYYDDEMIEMDGYDEPDPDSDFDYEDHYRGRRKKRSNKPGGRGRGSRTSAASSPKGDMEISVSGGRGGRGRKRALLYDMDNDKPFACELCSARYKTRPGLTYHYTHTHKETKECDVPIMDCGENSLERGSPKQSLMTPVPPVTVPPVHIVPTTVPLPPAGGQVDSSGPPGGNRRGRQSSAIISNPVNVSSEGVPSKPMLSVPSVDNKKEIKDEKPASSPAPKKEREDAQKMDCTKKTALPDDKARVAASPYCDFCLGDSSENKKTNAPEELVSCSDCGRSGHPSCLLFTQNMIISVRKYRWQCIECKCCSVCGTGYHMYCLTPPLISPPEGSWSCGLCLVEFHRAK